MPVFHFRCLPPLFGLSFGAFLGLVITAFVLGERNSHGQDELLSNYGQSLAHMVAEDVATPLLSRNLLSLHALMSDVAALPRVAFASVRSSEEELLAEAGTMGVDASRYAFFSVPIPLSEGMGGRVTLALDVGLVNDGQFRWVLVATGLLLLLMSLLALVEVRSELFTWPDKSDSDPRGARPSDDESPSVDDSGSSLEAGGQSSHVDAVDAVDLIAEGVPPSEVASSLQVAPEWHNSDLVLALPNYSLLEKQLSDIVFSRRVAQFERQFNSVLSLYNGFQVESSLARGFYCLRFKNHISEQEAAFSAVCAACLVQSLERRHKIKFHFLAAICAKDCDIKLSESESGVYVQERIMDDFLLERVEVEGLVAGYFRVVGFKAQYASLIEKQVERLQPLC